MKLNALTFLDKKKQKQKISMITCYDFSFAQIVNGSDIDCILVGDSAANTMHGFANTVHIDTQLMSHHVAAVSKGAPNKFVIGDLPFLSYRKSLTANMNCVETLMKAGAEALKLEGALGNLNLITHMVHSGVPVMGHLGLTPQSVHTLGGHKVQGREKQAQTAILDHAKKLEEAGCFSIVLECVPSMLAKKIADELHIPVIGIGAGPDVDGQVLVLQDLLGFNDNFKPKFLKKYFSAHQVFKSVFNEYHKEVTTQMFPTAKESYE
ncbi:MAG: 3-methyl-2-oxobutanoate hydroxymethyltransferase [Bdellovibrionaceae bacterium]|nr:3-methyl-2-oxobutanoate hydroxymethyltransferase [Pseudobdellovibrionaceae bacterium]